MWQGRVGVLFNYNLLKVSPRGSALNPVFTGIRTAPFQEMEMAQDFTPCAISVVSPSREHHFLKESPH
jgi:hypothetical protein